ncbi:zonula occludens toxin (Zot) family protein [Campylobacter sp. RM5004]|uniref:zonular occludens toxin domain-containing protein n=1 Tax=Campylobacter sp. RM5004 TaxID=1660078 RepID=UPI001EFAA0BC|nr:zonular occludens toxin domain-containing protein [Campylobacter sp. RM5004]ULO01291.1 zonula occludens toxin (Zot) family protein [Campylobacter sp. RM5004]
MSISFVTGIPGSGKTYYSVYGLYKSFIEPIKNESKKEDKKGLFSFLFGAKEEVRTYDYCYTNINEFNFSICDKIKLYEHDIIYEKLKILYSLHLNNADDKTLIEKAKEFKIFNSLFIIDECHNFYDKEDEVLIWFFTYHRHLFIDIYMITQDLALVETKFKTIAEFFFQALPNAKKINTKVFKYRQYLSYRMYQKDIVGNFSLPAKNEVFALYTSGAKNNSKSIVNRFIKFSIFLFIVTFFLFKGFMFLLNNNDKANETTKNINSQKSTNIQNNKNEFQNDFNINENIQINKTNYSNLYFYEVICLYEKTCIINDEYYIPYLTFKYITESSQYLYFNIENSNQNTLKFNLIYDYEIFKNLKKKGNTNEKNNSSFNFIN